MKKLFLSLSALACLAYFSACSTDVDLYADYKDIPVIYGLVDASQDTNFIRINRAFSGSNDNPINANEVALIADSCNYPGKLNAYIEEYMTVYGNNYEPTGSVFALDTMTIHDKVEGVFYAPDQKVYWTDAKFKTNANGKKYKYKLIVEKGDEVVSAETGVVGGEGFKVVSSGLSFAAEESDKANKIKFTAADNAVFYDMKMVFYYRESLNGGPFVDKEVSYSFGSKNIDELETEDASYYYSYSENLLFRLLKTAIGADTVVDPNHPNVVRYFNYIEVTGNYKKPMRIFLSAGGDELYTYIQVNSQTGFSQTIPDYTNVAGGRGVFSSRINISKAVTLSSRAITDIYAQPWGFIEQ